MTDIRREACKEMACICEFYAWKETGIDKNSKPAEMIRALRAALDAAEAEINRKADAIDDLLNKLAQADQDLHEATDAPNRHAYKVGIAVGRSQAATQPDVAGAARVLFDDYSANTCFSPVFALSSHSPDPGQFDAFMDDLRQLANGGGE